MAPAIANAQIDKARAASRVDVEYAVDLITIDDRVCGTCPENGDELIDGVRLGQVEVTVVLAIDAIDRTRDGINPAGRKMLVGAAVVKWLACMIAARSEQVFALVWQILSSVLSSIRSAVVLTWYR